MQPVSKNFAQSMQPVSIFLIKNISYKKSDCNTFFKKTYKFSNIQAKCNLAIEK